MTTSKSVVIIDYGLGNVASASKAFAKLGASVKISRDKNDINAATHLVLPGVGAFGEGIRLLEESGVIPMITERALRQKIPFLGICLGMQLLASTGNEFGVHRGLNWLPGTVDELSGTHIRLPHVGWNEIMIQKKGVLLQGLADRNFYFVHSFVFNCTDPGAVIATCGYGDGFVAVVEKGNIFGTQFHPEKSQVSGLTVLKNFLSYA